MNTDCHLDGRKLYFFDGRLENHEILARYTAGFTKETLPQDLAECIMNVFMHKSECARKRIKGGLEIKDYKILNGLEMPEEARQILEAYRRKTL